MASSEPADVAKSSPTPSPPAEPAAFERAKGQLVLACLVIAAGIAVAGSFERTTGGVLLVAGWALAIFGLHRLGRAGSDRPAKK